MDKANMGCTPPERHRKRCGRKNETEFIVKKGVHISERIPTADSTNDTISKD